MLGDRVSPSVREIWVPQPGPHLDKARTGHTRVGSQNDRSAWFGHEPPMLLQDWIPLETLSLSMESRDVSA